MPDVMGPRHWRPSPLLLHAPHFGSGPPSVLWHQSRCCPWQLAHSAIAVGSYKVQETPARWQSWPRPLLSTPPSDMGTPGWGRAGECWPLLGPDKAEGTLWIIPLPESSRQTRSMSITKRDLFAANEYFQQKEVWRRNPRKFFVNAGQAEAFWALRMSQERIPEECQQKSLNLFQVDLMQLKNKAD